MTGKQAKVLELIKEGLKPVEIQQQMGYKYIASIYQIINSLKLKGILDEKGQPVTTNNNQGV